MLCTRRNSGYISDFQILNSENIINFPKFFNNDLNKIVDFIKNKKGDLTRLYLKNIMTDKELIAATNFTLFKGDSLTLLELSDVNYDNILGIRRDKITLTEERDIVIREIILKDLKLPGPNYRILLDRDRTIEKRLIISIIEDEDDVSSKNFAKFVFDLAETYMQYILAEYNVPVFYMPHSFNAYEVISTDTNEEKYHSFYRAAGTIVLKDYPTISDIIFACNYCYELYNIVADTTNLNRSDILDLFSKDDFTNQEWIFTKDELDDMVYNKSNYKCYFMSKYMNTLYSKDLIEQ